MQPSPRDEAIWETAFHDSLVPPPRQWAFEDQAVKFGCDLYHVDKATLYELALLDIHSQYWETTKPEYLRKYHRGLQYNVEQSFRSENPTSTYHTPSFLKPWLVRVIFMKPHDKKGKRMVDYILNNVSKHERLKLETGNFQGDGTILAFNVFDLALALFVDWKAVISHKHHQTGLTHMIKTICWERHMDWKRNTGYPWSLPFFGAIQCQVSTDLGNHPAVLLYRYEVIEQKWQHILESSATHIRKIAGTPLQTSAIKRLLDGMWINDDVINAYLTLCGYLRPDIKFIHTHWFVKLGQDAPTKTVSWVRSTVSSLSYASQYQLMPRF
jgi:hypothetical protein